MKGIKNIQADKLIGLLFIVTVAIVTRQFPFSFLSPLMNVCVIAILFLTAVIKPPIRSNLKLIFTFLIFPLSFNLLYSALMTDNQITLGIKFYIVLLSIGLGYFVVIDKRALKWFIYLNIVQSLVLILIFILMTIFFRETSYLPLRFYFLEKGWGDIYTFNGYFYRIQIKGSALLLVAIILTNETSLIRKKKATLAILCIGLVIAGNFAFLISASIYILYLIFRLRGKSIKTYLLIVLSFLLSMVVLLPPLSSFVSNTLEAKKEESLGTRQDQAVLLSQDLTSNFISFLSGKGLGNTLDIKTTFRDYTGNTYFELQTLYVANQLGLIFFTIYILYHGICITKWKYHRTKIILTYFIYISYAITNPYIFDTNHFIVIVILNSWYENEQTETDNKHSGSNYFI